MISPLSNYQITQHFGVSAQDYSKFGYPGHNGVDLVTFDSPPVVYAACEGRCLKVGWDEGGYGKYIVLQHPTLSTYYCHLDQVFIKPGDVVDAGEPIGILGSTGNSTGPHLHFAFRQGTLGIYKGYYDAEPSLLSSDTPIIRDITTLIYVPAVSKIPTTGKVKKRSTHGKRTLYPRMKYF